MSPSKTIPKGKTKGKKRASPIHLREGQKVEVLKMLEQWQGRLRWEPFLDAVEQITGHRYTRQALWNHVRIRLLWIARRNELRHRAEKEDEQKGSLGVIAALEKRDRLQREVDHLKQVVSNYDEMFKRWAYNLKLKGFTDLDLAAQVDKPLPRKPKEISEPFTEAKTRTKRGSSKGLKNG